MRQDSQAALTRLSGPPTLRRQRPWKLVARERPCEPQLLLVVPVEVEVEGQPGSHRRNRLHVLRLHADLAIFGARVLDNPNRDAVGRRAGTHCGDSGGVRAQAIDQVDEVVAGRLLLVQARAVTNARVGPPSALSE